MEWTPLYLNADPTQPIGYTGMCQLVYGEKQAEMGREEFGGSCHLKERGQAYL